MKNRSARHAGTMLLSILRQPSGAALGNPKPTPVPSVIATPPGSKKKFYHLTLNQFYIMKCWFSFSVLFFVSTVFLSCDDEPTPQPVVAQTIRDLNADYAPLVFNSSGPPTRPGETGKFTLFNFKTGEIVPNTELNSTRWDIGFRATSLIFNSGSSGPGTVVAQIQNGIFDEITEAPESGYASDNGTAAPPLFVISPSPQPPGSSVLTNQWWRNGGSNTSTIVTPIAGRIIFVRTGDNRFVKMEILSYYKGAPAAPNNITDPDRHYTFRYIYQPNETRAFR